MLDVAIEAARAAGRVLAERYQGERVVEKKGAIDLVTDADRAAEAAALGVLRARVPDHATLAEEAGASGESRYLWVLDPLDGTTNYAHRVPHFSVSIACEVDGVAEVGVILDPMRDELFAAQRGAGATLNGAPIRTSAVAALDQALLATGFPYWVHERPERVLALFGALIRQAQGMRRFGSAALDLAWVASGRYDGFFEIGLRHWDYAAGALLVAEAGGVVSDLTGARVSPANGELIAAGAALHPSLVAVAERIR